MLAKASTLLFGAAAIPLFLRVLQQFQTHKQLGVLLVIIGEMMNDVASFMAIFVVFLLGFFIAFLAVMKVQAPFAALGLGHFDAGSFDEWHERPGVWNSWRAFEVPLWAMVGENSLEAVEEASPLVGIALLWIYIIIAQVLLVNLLIAMMSSPSRRSRRSHSRSTPSGACAPSWRLATSSSCRRPSRSPS